MGKFLLVASVVALCLVCTNGQVLRSGKCPNITAMADFNFKKFMGIWYEQVHTRRSSGDLRCSVEHFSQTGPKQFFINSFTYSPSVNRSYQIKGNAELTSPTTDIALLTVELPDLNLTGTVWVLGTDYKSFAVIWTCKNADNKYFENLIIMTRDKHTKSGPVLNALKVLTAKKIQKTSLQYVSQSGCPNYDVEMNRSFNASLAQKVAADPEIPNIDIRMAGDAAAPASAPQTTNSTM